MSLNGILERMIAGRWIAGESVSDAISVATRLNRRGVTAMVNYLGENFTEEKEVESAVKTYESVMAAASSVHARISLAVKPTELGLLIGQKTAEKRFFSPMLISARVFLLPKGTNIGSNPNPFLPLGLLTILPFMTETKSIAFFPSWKPTAVSASASMSL